jgi:hypothetical protein
MIQSVRDGGRNACLRQAVEHFGLPVGNATALGLEFKGVGAIVLPQQQVGCAGHHAHALEDRALDCGARATIGWVQVDRPRRATGTKMFD